MTSDDLVDLLAARCGRAAGPAADRPFLVAWDEDRGTRRLTFREFGAHVDATAAALRRAGVGAGDVLGLLSHNSPEYWVSIAACWATDIVAVLINHRQPLPILAVMTKAAGVTRLLASDAFAATAAHLLPLCSELRGPALSLQPNNGLSAIGEGSDEPPRLAAAVEAAAPAQLCFDAPRPSQLAASRTALVFFTSGSSGAPKPVPHTHAALLWARRQEQAWLERNGLLGPRGGDGSEGGGEGGAGGAGEGAGEGLLSFGPGFHVLSCCMTFLLALHCGVRCIDDGGAARRPSSARVVAAACEAEQPTLLSLPCVVLDQLAALLDAGQLEPRCLRAARAVLWGGATLRRQVRVRLAAHGLRLVATYGQTETAGYALCGEVRGGGDGEDGDAMAPIGEGVRCELRATTEASTAATAAEGELVLVGCRSACTGYLGGEARPHAAEACATGDIFSEVAPAANATAGSRRVRHVCRVDDVLVHSSGEMTNPLPLEASLLSSCGAVAAGVCVLGTGLPRPVLILELSEAGGGSEGARMETVRAAVAGLNRAVAPYSALRTEQVVVVAPRRHAPLHRSAKGVPSRKAAHTRFAPQLTRLFEQGWPRGAEGDGCDVGWLVADDEAPRARCIGDDRRCDAAEGAAALDSLGVVESGRGGGGGEAAAADSLQLVANGAGGSGSSGGGRGNAAAAVTAHVYAAAMVLVVLHHCTRAKEACGTRMCGAGMVAIERFGEAVAMPAFCLLAGARDAQLGVAALRGVAVRTTLLFGAALAVSHYSALPGGAFWFYRYLVFPSNRGLAKAPLREFFTMHCWFMLALPLWRLARYACARALPPRAAAWALPLLACLAHFGCWGNNCRWPLLRHPHELDDSDGAAAAYFGSYFGSYFGQWAPLHTLAASLPQNDVAVIAPLWLYYAALPALVPAGFPAALPDPLALPRRLMPRLVPPRVAAHLLGRLPGARLCWLAAGAALLAACASASAAPTIDAALWHTRRAYGCSRAVFPPRALDVRTDALQPCGEGSRGGWSARGLSLDAAGVALTLCGVLALCAAVPRRATPWSALGAHSLSVYLLHVYVLPAADFVLAPLLLTVGHFVHREAAAPVALGCAALLVRALALPLPALPSWSGRRLVSWSRRWVGDGVAAVAPGGKARGEAEPLLEQ